VVTYETIHVGDVTAPRAWIFRSEGHGGLRAATDLLMPGDRTMRLPLLCFVVRHPAHGVVLVDTGLHPDAATNLSRDYGRLTAMMFRSLKPAQETFAEQLRTLGVEPGQVETVVMTHLHADHTSAMRLLGAATFVISRAEWAAATSRGAVLAGYVAHHLPPAERVRRVDFERDGEQDAPFARVVDVFGDGSIRLVSTPGHTPGHLSVLLKVADAEVLLIGDAVYTLRSLHEELLPMRTVDDGLYLDSLRAIKAYAKARPDARLIPTHDEEAWRAS
jgi:glyoxylase-like metal-dependent hydrolase (beta-lactamase superfamily II)